MKSDLEQFERVQAARPRPTWEKRVAELEAFQERFGHCLVPWRWAENRKLGQWVHRVRLLKRRGQLSQEQTARLESMGFIWNKRDRSSHAHVGHWEARFEQLVAWKRRHGNFHVPQAENPRLAEWVERQRNNWWLGYLGQEGFERLNAIGFPWGPEDPCWDLKLGQLRAHQQRTGNCTLFFSRPGERELWGWAQAQRRLRQRGLLSPERIRLLEELGFDWRRHARLAPSAQEHWEAMFEAVREFHREHGHFRVLQDPPTWPGLRRWILRQRGYRRTGVLRPERFERLNAIGFPWGEQEDPRWDQRYSELAAYRRQYGHCQVPSHWPLDRTLGAWVMHQRLCRRLGRLGAEQIAKLDALGFNWGSNYIRLLSHEPTGAGSEDTLESVGEKSEASIRTAAP